MAEVSALPRAAQEKLARLQAQEAPAVTTPAVVTTPTPVATTPVATAATPTAATPVATPAADGTITISREEFNNLQAEAGKSRAAAARAETERLKSDELQQRLTELENTSKPVPTPEIPAPALPEQTVTFTADEEKDFGDSREFITKVVRQELNKVVPQINALLAQLGEKVKAVEGTATKAVSVAQAQGENSFYSEVQKAVPNIEAIKTHKNWGDFLDETEEVSGATYEQLLAHNVKNRRLAAVSRIYKTFVDKYMGGENALAGYAGGAPTGAATETPAATNVPVKLKMSARRKASEDYKFKRITWDQLQEIQKAFDEADKAGNIEYD